MSQMLMVIRFKIRYFFNRLKPLSRVCDSNLIVYIISMIMERKE